MNEELVMYYIIEDLKEQLHFILKSQQKIHHLIELN